MAKTKQKTILRISFNSPVVLSFTLICLAAYLLNCLTNGKSNLLLFEVYRSPLTNPLTYVRMFTHVFGHASWSHLINNMTLLLVIGPLRRKILFSRLAYRDSDHCFCDGNSSFYILPRHSTSRCEWCRICVYTAIILCMYKGWLHTSHFYPCCNPLYRWTNRGWGIYQGQCIQPYPYNRRYNWRVLWLPI